MTLFDLTHAMPAASRVGDPSLRSDATGFSMFYSQGRVVTGAAPETYDLGFTVEYAIKVTAIGARSVGGGISRIVPSVHSHSNVQNSIFELAFDNWNFPGAGTSLTPCFTMLNGTAGIYHQISNRSSIFGEARGSRQLVIGDTYHILGTLRASDGLCQVYVNGVLEGEASPNIVMAAWLDLGGITTDLSLPGRSLRQYFEIGTRFLDGAWRNVTNSGSANIDNVRWYNTHFTPSMAAIAASAIAFTPDVPTKNSGGYGATENELANNPEATSPFRLDSFWKQDGTRCYTVRQNAEAAQNDVSPAWGIQPGDWSNRVATAPIANNRSIWWSPDGEWLSICVRVPSLNLRIDVYDQSATPWDLTVLGAVKSKTFSPAGAGGPQDHIWSTNGRRFWVHYPAGATSSLYEYSASVGFDPTTLSATPIQSFDPVPDTGTNITTWAFSRDGTVLYAMDGQFLVSWDLSTPFDITTTSNFTTGPTVTAGNLSIPRGLNYRNDNGDIYVEGDQNLMRMAWFR